MRCVNFPPSGNCAPLSGLLGVGGARHRRASGFAGAMAARCGVSADRLLLAASGSAALWAALRGLSSLEPGLRAVAVPAWCCPSVPRTVLQAGLEPVLVDLDPSTLRYDASSLRDARRHGLLAVILAHFFGLPHPIPPGDWGPTAFLRDCAQDFDHQPADGIPCFYSFGRGKALNAGHGGALCIPEGGPLLKACVRALAGLPESGEDPRPMAAAINLLSRPALYWAVSRIPGLGLGRSDWKPPPPPARVSPRFDGVALASLDAYASCRGYYRRLIGAYRDLLSRCDGDRITSPAAPEDDRLPARFPALVREPALREALLGKLGREWGGVTRMYPAILPELPGAPAGLSMGAGFPGARRVAGEILTLPVTAAMRGREGAFFEDLVALLEESGAMAAPARAKPERGAKGGKGVEGGKAAEPGPDWSPVEGAGQEAGAPRGRLGA